MEAQRGTLYGCGMATIALGDGVIGIQKIVQALDAIGFAGATTLEIAGPDSVKSRSTPVSPIESAVQSDFISHLSDIAVRTGRKITWDPAKEEIIGDAMAKRLMHRPVSTENSVLVY